MRVKRPLGRPRVDKVDGFCLEGAKILQEEDQIDIAYNGEKWKHFVMVALDLNGPLSCI